MLINNNDNVEINLSDGHKYARCDIKNGENIIKYGQPIGHATKDIKKGDHVHSHNMKTNLSDNLEYSYTPHFYDIEKSTEKIAFMGYERENGDVGIRNDIWIINTVGCVNKIGKRKLSIIPEIVDTLGQRVIHDRIVFIAAEPAYGIHPYLTQKEYINEIAKRLRVTSARSARNDNGGRPVGTPTCVQRNTR